MSSPTPPLIVFANFCLSRCLEVNRFLARSGTHYSRFLRFPYPLTTAWLQLVITYCVILIVQYPVRFLFYILFSHDQTRNPEDGLKPLLLHHMDAHPPTPRQLELLSTASTGFARSTTEKRVNHVNQAALLLPVVNLLRVGAGNALLLCVCTEQA